MAEPLPVPPDKPTREEYRRWAEAQPRGRYEPVSGEVFAMTPERMVHAQIKAAGVACQALPDGVTVEVDESTDFEPDALVNRGDQPNPHAVAAPNPVVVVEVTSPGTRSADTGCKLTGCFRVPSIRHYLVVLPDRRMLVHHSRREDGGIETRMVVSGWVELDPPGIAITVEELFED